MIESTDTMDLYAEKYLIAYDLCKDGQVEEAIKGAMQALIDLSEMPRYWQIKNCTLIAWGLDDWYDAEDFRTLGEEIFDAISKEGSTAVADDENLTNEGVNELRHDLDIVADDQKNLAPVKEEDGEGPEAMVKTDDEEANEIEALMDEFGKQTVSRESNALYVVRQSLHEPRATSDWRVVTLEEAEKVDGEGGGK